VGVKIIPALTPSDSVGVVSIKYESQLKIWWRFLLMSAELLIILKFKQQFLFFIIEKKYWLIDLKETKLWKMSLNRNEKIILFIHALLSFCCYMILWVHPFSSLLFRTSGHSTGCSESTIEHNIVFPDVRNENRPGIRNR
jgi:hypothetical protein